MVGGGVERGPSLRGRPRPRKGENKRGGPAGKRSAGLRPRGKGGPMGELRKGTCPICVWHRERGTLLQGLWGSRRLTGESQWGLQFVRLRPGGLTKW